MRYVKPDELSAKDIGKFVHLDFGERSFGRDRYAKRPLEVVTIYLKGGPAKFIEHRVDDGFNIWFEEQYLESVDLVDGFKLRIIKSELLSIKGDSIRVESYFKAVDTKGEPVNGRSFTKELSFRKTALAEVLIHAK